MPNNKISGGRSVGGVAPAPAFVAELLGLFGGDVELTAAFVAGLVGFFPDGAAAQTTLDLIVATGSTSEANGRLIRDSILSSDDMRAFKLWFESTTSGNIVNNLASSAIFTTV